MSAEETAPMPETFYGPFNQNNTQGEQNSPRIEKQNGEQPELLLQMLQTAHISLEDINASQLVLVQADGNAAHLYAYAMNADGQWISYLQCILGHVGKNGVTSEKREGDKKTPTGLYPLRFAFGIEENPGSKLAYRSVTAESYWVDDPESVYYNQWVEGTAKKDWKSAEHLIDYPTQYAFAVVIGYNDELIQPGKGSAIFLHCGNQPTAGCVSIPHEQMEQLLQWLDPTASPMILIF